MKILIIDNSKREYELFCQLLPEYEIEYLEEVIDVDFSQYDLVVSDVIFDDVSKANTIRILSKIKVPLIIYTSDRGEFDSDFCLLDKTISKKECIIKAVEYAIKNKRIKIRRGTLFS